MKLPRSKYLKLELITKITGLILVAVSVDKVFRGDLFSALIFFISGGLISLIPLFINTET